MRPLVLRPFPAVPLRGTHSSGGALRLTTVLGFAVLVACNDPSDPGDPVPLTPASLEGRWVLIQVVLSTAADPVVSDTTQIPENGEVYEFTESGGVEYFCRCPRFDVAPTPRYTAYTITGDTLWLHQDEGAPHPRLAEVTTRRLILRNLGTFPHDITGDDVPENVTITDTYRKE